MSDYAPVAVWAAFCAGMLAALNPDRIRTAVAAVRWYGLRRYAHRGRHRHGRALHLLIAEERWLNGISGRREVAR